MAAPRIREGHFDHRDVRYRYVAWDAADAFPSREGRGAKAPIVLVHGFAQSAASWEPVAPLLAQRRTVYAFELVGHGGSQLPSSPLPYLLDAQAEALLAFLRVVASGDAGGGVRGRVSEKPVVVGYSMGGRVSLSAVLLDASAFGALVLESAGLGPADAVEREAYAQCDAVNARRLREAGVESFMDAWEQLPLFATQRTLPVAVRARVRAGRLSNDAEALARTFEHAGQHAMPYRADVLVALERLAAEGVPVSFLTGERDEKYRALACDLGSTAVRTFIVKGSGHNVHLESPEAFAQVLRENFQETR